MCSQTTKECPCLWLMKCALCKRISRIQRQHTEMGHCKWMMWHSQWAKKLIQDLFVILNKRCHKPTVSLAINADLPAGRLDGAFDHDSGFAQRMSDFSI